MKWMLILLVFGGSPVKTNMIFESLDACLHAEDTMRSEYARVYNDMLRTNPRAAEEANKQYFLKRGGLHSPGTCIPHSATL